MPPRPPRRISPADLIKTLFRHKKKIALWVLFVMASTIWAALFLPRKYESTAKAFVRLGRESVALDPTATTGDVVTIQETRENQMNSTRDMLTSRSLIERVVMALGPETILKGEHKAAAGKDSAGQNDSQPEAGSTGFMTTLRAKLQAVEVLPTVSDRERAVTALSKAIKVKIARNSNVIDISCDAKKPLLAQQILEAFMRAFQEQHLGAYRTPGSLEFFASQVDALKQELETSNAELRDAKIEAGVLSIEGAQKSLGEQLTAVESASMQADAALAASQATIESLRKSLSEVPAHLASSQTDGFPNAFKEVMQQETFKLQVSLRELEAQLGEEHKSVKAAREQLRLSDSMINTEESNRLQATTALNSAWQSLDLESRREEALASALKAKAGTLQEQLTAMKLRVRQLSADEVRIADLERRSTIAEKSYRSHVDSYEQARISNALEANRISNVNVVQPPTLIERPVSPNMSMILIFGIFATICGSLVLALGAEYLDQSLKTPEDVEEQLGLPVLAAVPRFDRDPAFLNN